jgi:hypothetical protein
VLLGDSAGCEAEASGTAATAGCTTGNGGMDRSSLIAAVWELKRTEGLPIACACELCSSLDGSSGMLVRRAEAAEGFDTVRAAGLMFGGALPVRL